MKCKKVHIKVKKLLFRGRAVLFLIIDINSKFPGDLKNPSRLWNKKANEEKMLLKINFIYGMKAQ